MDLASEELEYSGHPQGIRFHSQTIPQNVLSDNPNFSFVVAHRSPLAPHLSQLQSNPVGASADWSKLLIFQFFYLIFLFAFSLLSTAAIVFTVASLHASKPVSFSSTIDAIPRVFNTMARRTENCAFRFSQFSVQIGLKSVQIPADQGAAMEEKGSPGFSRHDGTHTQPHRAVY